MTFRLKKTHSGSKGTQSNSHTFLARILQKWYISDNICKNLAIISDFRQTCQILADQTFLADSDISYKILAGQDLFWTDNVWKLKHIQQKNVWNVLKTSRLFFQFQPKNMFEMNVRVSYMESHGLECDWRCWKVICLFQNFRFWEMYVCHNGDLGQSLGPCPNLRGSWWRNYSSVHAQWAETNVRASRKNTRVNSICYCLLYNRYSPEGSLILMKTKAADYPQSDSWKFGHLVHLTATTNLNHICWTNA